MAQLQKPTPEETDMAPNVLPGIVLAQPERDLCRMQGEGECDDADGATTHRANGKLRLRRFPGFEHLSRYASAHDGENPALR